MEKSNWKSRFFLSGLSLIVILSTAYHNVAFAQEQGCFYQGQQYSTGGQVCINGIINQCDGWRGVWVSLGVKCH